MKTDIQKNIFVLKGFYLLTFFGVGSLFPLLGVYLSEVEGLNGYQIGTLLSIGPIITIFFQPFWGMISDITHAHTRVLSITTLMAGIFGIGFLLFEEYVLFILVAVFIAVFQSAIIPISDSISIKYTTKVNFNYGSVRLYGSLGFGLAVFIMGRISEYNQTIIFYSFLGSLFLAACLAVKLPKEQPGKKPQLLKGVKEILLYKKFLLFLAITFLIFGPNLANNFYFGLFVEDSGGTYTGIGIAFLLAVLSEIPFMRMASSWIHRFGLLQIAAIAGTVSLIRWLLYFTEPSLSVIYVSSVIQGFSLGLFIPAGIQYIRDITPAHITATAITLYSAIGNGLGNWFSTFLGGIIYEEVNIYTVYLFFAALAFIGVLLNLWLIKEEKADSVIQKAFLK